MRSDIKLQLSRLTPVGLLALSRNVVSKMTDNVNFPTPLVDLKSISNKALELEKAIEEATNGSRQSKLHRNDVVLEMEVLIRALASYVRTVCYGDKTLLESSGFELKKEPEKLGVPDAPTIKSVESTGVPGQIELKYSKEKGAKMYQILMAENDPAIAENWSKHTVVSKTTVVIDDLVSYKPYWFGVIAMGAAGEGAMSSPAVASAK